MMHFEKRLQFALYRKKGGKWEKITTWSSDSLSECSHELGENDCCALSISGDLQNANYYIKVGDRKIKPPNGWKFRGYTKPGCYLESACGETVLAVCREDNDEEVGKCSFSNIGPSKIDKECYENMLKELRSVYEQLIRSLAGKSQISLELKAEDRPQPRRAFDAELDAVKEALNALAPLLDEVERAPMSRVQLQRRAAAIGRCTSHREVMEMMKKGIDPSKPAWGRKGALFRAEESFDVPEHRMVNRFMDVLFSRIRQCHKVIRDSIEEYDNDFSRLTGKAHESAKDEHDGTKERLGRYRDNASRLAAELRDMKSSDFWRNIGSVTTISVSGRFQENKCYRKIAGVISKYLSDGLNFSKVADDKFMRKPTSDMYEEWVLVQLIYAFKHVLKIHNVEVDTWDGVLGVNDLGLAPLKGASCQAKLNERYSVRLRYEPSIPPTRSSYPKETLFHTAGKNPLTPDYVIELLDTKEGAPKTVYAIALDAKYTPSWNIEGKWIKGKWIKGKREEVRKYFNIYPANVEGTDNAIVKQIWLVYPGEKPSQSEVYMCGGCTLSPTGPMWSDANTTAAYNHDPKMEGGIVVRPDSALADNVEDNVRKPFLYFASSIFAYFRKYAKINSQTP